MAGEITLSSILPNLVVFADVDGTLGEPGYLSYTSLIDAYNEWAGNNAIASPLNPWNFSNDPDGIPPCTDQTRISALLKAQSRSDLDTRDTYEEITALRAKYYPESDLVLYPGTLDGLKALRELGGFPIQILTGNPDTPSSKGEDVVRIKLKELFELKLVEISNFNGRTSKLVFLNALNTAFSQLNLHVFYAGDAPIDFASWLSVTSEKPSTLSFLLKSNLVPKNEFRVTLPDVHSNNNLATTYFNINDPLMRLGLVSPFLDRIFSSLDAHQVTDFAEVLGDPENACFNQGKFKDTVLAKLGDMILENVTIPEVEGIDTKRHQNTLKYLLLYYLKDRVPAHLKMPLIESAEKFPDHLIYPHHKMKLL